MHHSHLHESTSTNRRSLALDPVTRHRRPYICGAHSSGTPTVLAANGLICIGTDTNPVLVVCAGTKLQVSYTIHGRLNARSRSPLCHRRSRMSPLLLSPRRPSIVLLACTLSPICFSPSSLLYHMTMAITRNRIFTFTCCRASSNGPRHVWYATESLDPSGSSHCPVQKGNVGRHTRATPHVHATFFSHEQTVAFMCLCNMADPACSFSPQGYAKRQFGIDNRCRLLRLVRPQALPNARHDNNQIPGDDASDQLAP